MNKTVLVTGATGFLGSYIVKKLLQTGYKTIILKRSFSNTYRIDKILSKVICYNIDQCNITQPFQDFNKIDAIIHLATNYGRKKENISSIIEDNILLPIQLLEKASSCFLNTDTVLPKSLNSYSISKHQFREWGQQLANLEKFRFINVKMDHIFGPQDDENKFTTYIIKGCLTNKLELDLTLGEQKRNFIYVDDVVSAYIHLLETACQQPLYYQEYEIGHDQAVSIRQFAERVKFLTNSKTKLNFGALPYRKNELMDSQINLELMKSLGWDANYSLEVGLKKTIEWYKNNLEL